MPGYHSPKQKRQAKHIEDSEEESGKSEKESKAIAWATVNKQKTMQGVTKRQAKLKGRKK